MLRVYGKGFVQSFLKKCRGEFECMIYEMLWIKNKGPKLNTQADSIRAKLFTWVNAFMLIYFLSSNIYKYALFLISSFDNDMKSSKRHVILLPLIFLLKCLSKSFFTCHYSRINTIQKLLFQHDGNYKVLTALYIRNHGLQIALGCVPW